MILTKPMSRIIAIANQKGGVGKTTLTFNLGGALAELGQKVLLIDLDPQGNLSSVFIDNIHSLSKTIADVLLEDQAEFEEVINKTQIPNLDLIASNLALNDIDTHLAGNDDAQYMLIDEIKELKDSYDYILIDCPPNLGKATRIALVTAQELLIPIECQGWAVKGSSQLLAYVEKIRKKANPNLRVLGFLINKYDPRRNIEKNYYKVLKETYKDLIFKAKFYNHVQYTEAATNQKPITMYLPHSRQARAYRKLAQEIIHG